MVSLLLFIVAALLNAAMDTMAFHWSKSIFSGRGDFWTVDKFKLKLFTYPVNAWHLLKSGMIISLAVAAITYRQMVSPWVDLVIFGCAWNVCFNIAFGRLFLKK